MFDLRYHVASLAAVFLALVIGILVGVALSDPGLADRAKMARQADEITRLQAELRLAASQREELGAAQALAEAAYPLVIEDRLDDRSIALVFVGSVDDAVRSAVETVVADAGGKMIRVRALRVPLPTDALERALVARPTLAEYNGDEDFRELGRDLGRELVRGGDTPLWDALTRHLVEERTGGNDGAVDAVVVVRSAEPQRGETARFLAGFYAGLGGRAPVVGVETLAAATSAIRVFERAGFSTVDAVDTPPGKVALAVLLAGGRPGHYGVKETASRVLPPIEALEPARQGG